jgi:hypothetical protein
VKPVRKLRALIVLLLPRASRARRALRRCALGLRFRCGLLLLAERTQGALQVVEDEADGRLRASGRGDQAVAVGDEEDAPATERDVELDELSRLLRPGLVRRAQQFERGAGEAAGAPVEARTVPSLSRTTAVSICVEISVRSARGPLVAMGV